MAKKKNTIPSGFDDVLGNIYSNAEQGEGITDMNTLLQGDTEIPFEEEEEEKKEPPVNTEDGNKTDDTQDPHKDDSEIPDDVINNTTTTTEEETITETEEETEPSDADVVEAQQVGLLFDAIGQSLGWNINDIDEKDRPLTVNDLTDYLAETVKQNSVPHYADERIQRLDEYVKNGGKFEDFYQKQSEGLSLENIDMEDEVNQKAVIRELLKYGNYSDEQINKKISRYEERYGLHFAQATLSFPDYDNLEITAKIILDTLSSEAAALTAEQQEALFEGVWADYDDITVKKKRYEAVREDKYFNALQVKYATAITCHKSQGGGWPCVYIDNPFWGPEVTIDDIKWLYTAITRATEKVFFVNFPDNCFKQ